METGENSRIAVETIWFAAGFLLLFIVGVLLLVRAFILRMKKEDQYRTRQKLFAQEQLLKNTLRTQEQERERIALDLHDNLVSELNLMRLQIAKGNPQDPLYHQVSASMKTARRISHDLTPPFMHLTGLDALLQDYLIEHKHLFPADYSCIYKKNTLDVELKLQVFRIFQEVVNNTLKHAEASRLEVLFRESTTAVSLVVRDNGKGMQEKTNTGLGTQNIQSRAQFLNAQHKWKSKPGKGTSFILYFTR